MSRNRMVISLTIVVSCGMGASLAKAVPYIRVVPVVPQGIESNPYPPGTVVDPVNRIITIPSAPARFWLEMRYGDWASAPGPDTLFSVDAETKDYNAETGGLIHTANEGCATQKHCNLALGWGVWGEDCTSGQCNEAFILDNHAVPEFIFNDLKGTCYSDTESLACFAVLFRNDPFPDDGLEHYLGTLIFDASVSASGCYSLGLTESGTYMRLGDDSEPAIDRLGATVCLQSGPVWNSGACCHGGATPACIDSITSAECEKLPGPRIWRRMKTCAESDCGQLDSVGFGDHVCVGGINDRQTCGSNVDCPGGLCHERNRFLSPGMTAVGTPTAIVVRCDSGACPIGEERYAATVCVAGSEAGNLCDEHVDCPDGMCGWYGSWPDGMRAIDVAGSGGAGYYSATTACSPFFRDWSNIGGLAHIYGSFIMPDSTYSVYMHHPESVAESTTRAFSTATWGDVIRPLGQPNFGDINSVVDTFRGFYWSLGIARADLSGGTGPGQPDAPDLVVNFADIANDVDAFRGLPYPFTADMCP